MSNSEVLTVDRVNNAADLLATLQRILAYVGVDSTEIVTFGAKGEGLRVRVIQDTLTDGSKVYNINIE